MAQGGVFCAGQWWGDALACGVKILHFESVKTTFLGHILGVVILVGSCLPAFGQVDGDIILPKIRIGKVPFILRPDSSFEKAGLVYIFPQVELLYPTQGKTVGLQPVFRVSIEVEGHDPYEASNRIDRNGLTICKQCFGPYKPDPIPLAWIEEAQGLVKITFDREILGYFDGQSVPLQFESDTLSFWYDVLNDKRVQR
jgi:hypothetical protein